MKRFTETTKWDDPWFRKLSPKLKCLWQYVCDRCDGAGVIDIDYELASFQIGTKITDQDMEGLGDRTEKLQCGKWWIVRFIPFQYGKLSEECKAHGPVFSSLSAYGLQDRVSKGIPRGIHTLKETDKEKDNGRGGGETKEPTKRKDRGTREEIIEFCVEELLPRSDADAIFHKWEGNGWTNGGKPIKDWKATIRSWKAQKFLPSQKNGSAVHSTPNIQPTSVEKAVEDFYK